METHKHSYTKITESSVAPQQSKLCLNKKRKEKKYDVHTKNLKSGIENQTVHVRKFALSCIKYFLVQSFPV